MEMYESDDEVSHEAYVFSRRDRGIVAAAQQLLWKIVRSDIIQPDQLVAVSKILKVLNRLPAVGDELDASFHLTGPRRRYGEHKIFHFWEVTVDGHYINVSSGGHFWRAGTGGDTFMCMTWFAEPGHEVKYSDCLHTLSIVDDAQSFETEVMQLNLTEAGFSLEIYEDGEQIVGSVEEENDDLNVIDDGTIPDISTPNEPRDESEPQRSKRACAASHDAATCRGRRT